MHDQPVNIAGLKRFATDMAINDTVSIVRHGESETENANASTHFPGKLEPMSNWKQYECLPESKPDTGQTIAIVGGGPAGLTAAYFLRRAGHKVTVYERMPKMGGLLRYGIPEYRLPKAVLDAEVKLLTQMGIQFQNEAKLISEATVNSNGHVPANETHITLPRLQQQFDAVIIATGAGAGRPVGIPGEGLPHVISGIDFLKKAACDTASVARYSEVAIIGGSNTAIDAARTALRLGAETVTIAYRRTKEEMPASPSEIAEAEEEGVKFMFLVMPLEITESSIHLQTVASCKPAASNRQAPPPIPGQDKWLKADTVITAIGQSIDPSGLETLAQSQSGICVNTDTFQTSQPKVFAIGDATGQSAYAIEAIGHGRKAAAAVQAFLSGAANMPTVLCETLADAASIPTVIHNIPRENPIKKVAPEGYEEVHQSLTAAQAINEASRCLSCGCGGYSSCKLIALANQYNPKNSRKNPKHPINTNNPLFIYDPNKCILCGLCIQACAQDRAILTMAHRGIKAQVEAQPETGCAQCGNCVAICPVGARVARLAQTMEKS